MLWEEFRVPYFLGEFSWRMNLDLGELGYAGLAKFGRVRKVHDVFAYAVITPKQNEPSWVVLNFYESLELLARVDFSFRLAP